MWKKLILPRKIILTIQPRFNSHEQKLILKYNLSGMNWILKLILNIARRYARIKITATKIIIPLQSDMPYRIEDISGHDITINLKRR
ncbi:MAG: hypothetical protein D8M58_21860 [Calditrichaeota bacterium]|nr:MAG: hypothetical protein DWQ03_00615 [Calditrichota bacterium]MBL1208062.1 hypothetical protein [Calditrichota bacterium]